MVIAAKTMQIIAIAFAKGAVHDFKLYQTSLGKRVTGNHCIIADSGYQGIKKLHFNSTTPIKKSKKRPLSKTDKEFNHELSKVRIKVEQINAKFKTFKIMAEKYRNRRRRFKLRASLICGLCNYELPKL
ncbi:transposase family protein [Lactobacillus sp. ESL0791]|uniref:transposase family protein n=1 Tax=Lactobacillus sp. ESL0791 TaxID=2983234 RepID=UPI0027E16B2D|nr:transposase family protein [Lactobacillus sp. ESL0791]